MTTPQLGAGTAPSTPHPRAVQLMINRLAPGWTYTVTHGAGTITRKPTDLDTRKQYEKTIPVRSAGLRMRHLGGRAAVGIWLGEWRDEVVTPACWVERKATKRLGARSVHVPEKVEPAHWHYGLDSAWTWSQCRHHACPKHGVDHPDGMPLVAGEDGLKAWISAPLLSLERLPHLSPNLIRFTDEMVAA